MAKKRTGLMMKLAALKREYFDDPESLRHIEGRERQLQEAIDASSLKEDPVVQKLVEDAHRVIGGINALLLGQKKLSEIERASLLTEREVHEFWINRFDADLAGETIKAISRFIESHVTKPL